MDGYVDQRDLELLEGDKYTFAVLSRILKGTCRLILTDHKRLIICHSADPYPVWIWTPDDISAEEKKRAWQAVTRSCPLTEGYRINLKYELAEFFLARSKKQGVDAAITVNMFAYDCPVPVMPEHKADGHIYLCTREDLEEAADTVRLFQEEVGMDQCDKEGYLNKARALIENRRLFFWKDDGGRTVARCHYLPDGDLASVCGVYTFPAYRRKHYAQNLVYQVTKIVEGTGAMPMLYTDADYAASNACYEKIGYVMKGRLCTVGAENRNSGNKP